MCNYRDQITMASEFRITGAADTTGPMSIDERLVR